MGQSSLSREGFNGFTRVGYRAELVLVKPSHQAYQFETSPSDECTKVSLFLWVYINLSYKFCNFHLLLSFCPDFDVGRLRATLMMWNRPKSRLPNLMWNLPRIPTQYLKFSFVGIGVFLTLVNNTRKITWKIWGRVLVAHKDSYQLVAFDSSTYIALVKEKVGELLMFVNATRFQMYNTINFQPIDAFNRWVQTLPVCLAWPSIMHGLTRWSRSFDFLPLGIGKPPCFWNQWNCPQKFMLPYKKIINHSN